MKKYAVLAVVTALITLLPMFVGLILWEVLPPKIATHFGVDGTPDGFMSLTKWVYGVPLLMLLFHAVCIAYTFIDPRRKNIGKKPMTLMFWIVPLISTSLAGIMYAYAFGADINMAVATQLLLGIVYIVIGNYLPKCGQNYTIGIKTPWTLNDAGTWTATHRFGGKLFIAAGVISVLTAWLKSLYIVLATAIIASLAVYVYSFVYYKRHVKEDN